MSKILDFPIKLEPLSSDELAQVTEENTALMQILSAKAERMEVLDMNTSIEFRVGDFYLLARSLMLTKIELESHIITIATLLSKGA